MSAALVRGVAPVLKIRTVLRDRSHAPAPQADNVVSMENELMLGWAEREVADRVRARELLSAANREMDDVRALARSVAQGGEVSQMDAFLLFSKIESARGLTRQALDLVALCCLALVVWLAGDAGTSADDDDHAVRVTRTLRVRKPGGRRREEVEI